ETGCYLYIAAQHPNASGQFLHYTSTHLHDEAKDSSEGIQYIVNKTNKLLS
ncbi:hypothetical protein BDQ12DRAFT_587650, partial [Crucibulum laeve]